VGGGVWGRPQNIQRVDGRWLRAIAGGGVLLIGCPRSRPVLRPGFDQRMLVRASSIAPAPGPRTKGPIAGSETTGWLGGPSRSPPGVPRPARKPPSRPTIGELVDQGVDSGPRWRGARAKATCEREMCSSAQPSDEAGCYQTVGPASALCLCPRTGGSCLKSPGEEMAAPLPGGLRGRSAATLLVRRRSAALA